MPIIHRVNIIILSFFIQRISKCVSSLSGGPGSTEPSVHKFRNRFEQTNALHGEISQCDGRDFNAEGGS